MEKLAAVLPIIDYSLYSIELCPATMALAVYTYPLCF